MATRTTRNLGQYPVYILVSLALLSATTRTYTSLTGFPPSPQSSQLSLLKSLQIFPSSNPQYAITMDILLTLLLVYPPTRFLACGSILVLLGMSTGTTMRISREKSEGALTGQGQAFEAGMFKLMIANLATLASWRDSGVAEWWRVNVEGQSKQPQQRQGSAIKNSGLDGTVRSRVDIKPGLRQRTR